MDKQWCNACGAEKIDGKHPDQSCAGKEWAAHQGRLLQKIVDTLTALSSVLKGSGQGKPTT